MGSSNVKEDIPFASNRDFPCRRIYGEILNNSEAVRRGKSVYQNLKKQGLVKIFKETHKNLETEALPGIAERLRCQESVHFLSLKLFCETVTSTFYGNNVVEEIECGRSGSMFFYSLIRFNGETNKYNIAIFYLKVKCSATAAVMIAGLLTEGILSKDEEDQLFLQL